MTKQERLKTKWATLGIDLVSQTDFRHRRLRQHSARVGPYLSDRAGQDGGMKPLYRIEERQENLVASFGEARLVQSLDGRFELRGGSQADRVEAHEWVSLFLHEVAVRQK